MAKRIPPSILKGILSLLGNKVPKWLTNLISKTKGGKEYVENIIEFENPPGSVERLWEVRDKLKKEVDFMGEQTSDLMEKHPFLTKDKEFMELEKLKQLQIEKFKEAIGYDDFLKKSDETLEDLDQKMKLLNPDDDDPTYHASGGIAGFAPGGIKVRTPKLHDTGLMKSLLKLGTTMGMSEKELLEMAIKFNWGVSDKLKKQYGITDEGLRAGSDKGLEWLLLKANPDLAKQPYSKSKVNEMLSEEIDIETPLGSEQLDLFEKKNGGLISLIS